MKNLILLFAFLATFTPSVTAQDILLEFASEFNNADLKFDWDSSLEEQTGGDDLNYNFSLGASVQVYKFIYLKTAIGSNDLKNLVSIHWNSEKFEHQLSGWIYLSQNYLEVLPEVRLLKGKWLFINMGVGFNQIRNAEFLNGSYQLKRHTDFFYEDQDFPKFYGKYSYFAFNCGLTYEYRKLGILIAFGTRKSSYTKTKTLVPGLGINQRTLKIGISYKLH